jgi:thioredoxin-dependent peroxiredoxin
MEATHMLNAGEHAPDFTLPSDGGEDVTLSSFRGRPVILYFYPRDDTPGCTTEACGIRDAWSEFEQAGAIVLGVSTDSVKSHQKFRSKYNLPFPLLADTEHQVAEQYGAWGEKKFMGKLFNGVHRVTYLIDENGVIKRAWPKVKPEGHAGEILEALRS